MACKLSHSQLSNSRVASYRQTCLSHDAIQHQMWLLGNEHSSWRPEIPQPTGEGNKITIRFPKEHNKGVISSMISSKFLKQINLSLLLQLHYRSALYVAITRHSHQRISFNGLRIQHYTGLQSGVLIIEAPSILRIQHYTGLQSGVLITEAPSMLRKQHTEWCPYYRGSLHTICAYSTTLGYRVVSLLQRLPPYYAYSTTLGYRVVSLL